MATELIVFSLLMLGMMMAVSGIVGYFAWFNWPVLTEFLIRLNRNNPLFKYYRKLYVSDLSKWSYRVIFPMLFSLVAIVFIFVLFQI